MLSYSIYERGCKMVTLKETAQNFVPKKVKNISELNEISTDCEVLHDGKGYDSKEDKEFNYSYIVLNNEQYRVPASVLGQLKDVLEEKPNLKKFKVKRTGEGRTGTKYTLITLD